jgi:hypothetical protein|nr:MAG TPA: hypothetical protein [Caudoviricetes sp.]
MAKKFIIEQKSNNLTISLTNPEIFIEYDIYEYEDDKYFEERTKWFKISGNESKSNDEWLNSPEYNAILTKWTSFDTSIYELQLESVVNYIPTSEQFRTETSILLQNFKIKYSIFKKDLSISNDTVYLTSSVKMNLRNKLTNNQLYTIYFIINKDNKYLELEDFENKESFQTDGLTIIPQFKDGKIFKNYPTDFQIYILSNPFNSTLSNLLSYNRDENKIDINNFVGVDVGSYEITVNLSNYKIDYKQEKKFTLLIKKQPTSTIWKEKITDIIFYTDINDDSPQKCEITIDNTKDTYIVIN